MELVRYKAGEAIRWLQTGAENSRKDARVKGRSVVKQEGVDQRSFGQNVKTAAGALIDLGKSAYTDLLHDQAQASEYVLQEHSFDVVKGSSIKTIPYERVKKIELEGDKSIIILDKGTMVVKPFAHIVAGRVKVPIGWSRNGIEVPYELLMVELAARCKVEIDEEE